VEEPRSSAADAAHEGPLLPQDQPTLLGEREVGATVRVGAQPRAIRLVVGEAREPDDAVGDVVRALMRAYSSKASF